jgi:FkbM family methyltransferase
MRMPMSDLKRYETRDGPMLGFAADTYISRSLELYGEYCPGERLLYQQLLKPGQTVVEAGANIGAHTLAIARRVAPGLVYAFEPQQRVFQALCANLALNDVTNVVAHPTALGAEPGWAVIPEVDYATAWNPGAVGLHAEGDPGLRTQVTTIDDLDLAACHLIKVDVEGLEPAVLVGAAKTVARCRPIIYVENDRAENQQLLLDLVASFGYRMYWHTPKLFDADNFKGSPENVFPGVASLCVLAIPAERPSNIPNKPIDPKNWTSPARPAQAV